MVVSVRRGGCLLSLFLAHVFLLDKYEIDLEEGRECKDYIKHVVDGSRTVAAAEETEDAEVDL